MALIFQSAMLAVWVTLNIVAYVYHWDPYPFILLNLALSFQAAYAAPIIMMSQNRQAEKDRLQSTNDYEVNLKAELEIMQLHEKFDESATHIGVASRACNSSRSKCWSGSCPKSARMP